MCPYVPFVRALFFSKIWWIRRKNTIFSLQPKENVGDVTKKRWRERHCIWQVVKTRKRFGVHWIIKYFFLIGMYFPYSAYIVLNI